MRYFTSMRVPGGLSVHSLSEDCPFVTEGNTNCSNFWTARLCFRNEGYYVSGCRR